VSANIFQQICNHNQANNSDVFYIKKNKKARVGKSYCWILHISKNSFCTQEESKPESSNEPCESSSSNGTQNESIDDDWFMKLEPAHKAPTPEPKYVPKPQIASEDLEDLEFTEEDELRVTKGIIS
jgi:hypothetical protein